MSNTNSAGGIPASEPPSSFAGNGVWSPVPLGTEPPEPESTFIGPLCDPIGFVQHSGECWSDSIMESFIFADGIKDIAQPLLYNTFTNEAKTDEYLRELFKEYEESNTFYETIKDIKRIIMRIATRFKYHYDYIKFVDSECKSIENNVAKRSCIKKYKEKAMPSSDVCLSPTPETQLIELKRQHSAELSPLIAINMRNTHRKLYQVNDLINTSGGNSIDTILYIKYLLSLFELTTTMHIYVDHKLNRALTDVSKIPNTFYSPLTDINLIKESSIIIYNGMYNKPEETGHAISLIKCNNTWYLYDNNFGMHIIPDLYYLNASDIDLYDLTQTHMFLYKDGVCKIKPRSIIKSTKGLKMLLDKHFKVFYPYNQFIIGKKAINQAGGLPTPSGLHGPSFRGTRGYKKTRGRGSKRKTRKARRHRRSR